jgi:flagellar hook-basal body protein
VSFYTALTGLNAATAQLEITSNNIANVNTSGFKRSRADFGDIFATSPLQKASAVIGQGVALKEVSQEFSQGNIQSSANALDMAISGDGFFQLKSADGLQDIYTRNGSFTLNDQYNVVNSAGQALQAASVDSSGKADLSSLDRLTIPKKTTGDAQQTSLVQLGLNFPADAEVIKVPFSRSNPASYNKTTALTVYDQGGNSYLATVYYVKTQNASQLNPTNKWQTYVYIGENQVSAALQQATDANGEKLYVNKYGELAPYSQVSDKLVNRKTAMFELNDLNDQRTSAPASITGVKTSVDLTAEQGIDFSQLTAPEKASLSHILQLEVDGSGKPIVLDISSLAERSGKVNGNTIAREMTLALQKAFGDDRYFDFTRTSDQQFTLAAGTATLEIDLSNTAYGTHSVPSVNGKMQTIIFTAPTQAGTITVDGESISYTAAAITAGVTAEQVASDFASALSLTDNGDGSITKLAPAASFPDIVTDLGDTGATAVSTRIGPTDLSIENTVRLMQKHVDAAIADLPSPGTLAIKVGYDRVAKGFTFTEVSGAVPLSIRGGGAGVTGSTNELLGLTNISSYVPINETGVYVTSSGKRVTPNGDLITTPLAQRYGVGVEYDGVAQKFRFFSGTTGDNSTLKIAGARDFASTLLGLSEDLEVSASSDAVRGTASLPAVTQGFPIAINVAENFSVDDQNNRFVVTVDDVKGLVTLPTGSNYTLDGFISELETQINQLAGSNGSTVSGVQVDYDRQTNSLKFTSGTTGNDSFIQVSGSTMWGLLNVPAGRGQTSSWIKPTQYIDFSTGTATAKYIDERGREVDSSDGYIGLPEYSPIYLHKGELTFNTAGTLISPKSGAQLDTVYLADGKGALTINIDYSKSTQFSSPFAVLSQSQDGAPEGDLIGVNIADDGLVNASYSNGAQKSLGKIVLVNFSNPNGLRQIGDSSFYSSSASGTPKLGEAGAAGFGTIRAGATERANVDLTQELVDLITGQRNFQASAKAIETNTALTQSIINIRS